jgi:nucleotide-binding universal stress UspA family protein
MTAYRTIVVGTDGSESSYRAVACAGSLAAAADARLVVACAYRPEDDREIAVATDVLKNEAYQVRGSAPSDDILRTAAERAKAAGASAIERRAVVGDPVESLLSVAEAVDADLIVVGNRGMNTVTGRLLGSVPSDVARQADCDVLIVDTTRTGKERGAGARRWFRRPVTART